MKRPDVRGPEYISAVRLAAADTFWPSQAAARNSRLEPVWPDLNLEQKYNTKSKIKFDEIFEFFRL